MSWISYGAPGDASTVLRREVPATPEMLLTLYLGEGDPEVVSVTWTAAGGLVLAEDSPGASVRVDLGLALGRRFLIARALLADGRRVTVSKDTRFVAASAEDLARYAAPAAAATLPTYGCRIPYADLERITPAQARARASAPEGLLGVLVEGGVRFDHPGTITATDLVIEARGRSPYLLTSAGNGRGYVDLEHVTVSGLERDAAGEPVTAWDVDRVASLVGSTLRAAELSWGNDTAFLGSNGRLLDSWCHSHTDYVSDDGARQHPDSIQLQQGGGQVASGNLLDGSLPEVPIRADGGEVRAVTRRSRTAQTFMVNNDNTGLQGRVTFTGNVLRDGSAVMVSISPGMNSTDYQWWQLQDGPPERGLVCSGNVIEVPSKYGPLRGPRELVEAIIADPTNVVRGENGSETPWWAGPRMTWRTASYVPVPAVTGG